MSEPADDLLAELANVTGQLAALRAHQDALVARSRAGGATWAPVADALDVSVQAAHKRYRDIRLDPQGPTRRCSGLELPGEWVRGMVGRSGPRPHG